MACAMKLGRCSLSVAVTLTQTIVFSSSVDASITGAQISERETALPHSCVGGGDGSKPGVEEPEVENWERPQVCREPRCALTVPGRTWSPSCTWAPSLEHPSRAPFYSSAVSPLPRKWALGSTPAGQVSEPTVSVLVAGLAAQICPQNTVTQYQRRSSTQATVTVQEIPILELGEWTYSTRRHQQKPIRPHTYENGENRALASTSCLSGRPGLDSIYNRKNARNGPHNPSATEGSGDVSTSGHNQWESSIKRLGRSQPSTAVRRAPRDTSYGIGPTRVVGACVGAQIKPPNSHVNSHVHIVVVARFASTGSTPIHSRKASRKVLVVYVMQLP
ncbi:hypothetical protein EDB85DRAFT_1895867 [Lactarius pseudohatsudake]|nr:hypothetical protein EDB85DRAFT_1895867 [Lactarius pseudohatsudake]